MNSVMNTNRLVLGTVQLGMDYGISNTTGKPEFSEASLIVKEAYKNGIREFDTAQAYGDSEKILGNIITKLGIEKDIRIISKFSPDIDINSPAIIRNAIAYTLSNLKLNKLHCIMFHNEAVLEYWSSSLNSVLESLINKGLVDHIGISVSSPRMAIKALENNIIKIIQIPSNVLDRRFENECIFEMADKYSKIIYIRSIFLQGLLMMSHKMLPEKMKFAENSIRRFDEFINEEQIQREVLLMSYPREAYPSAKILFGAESEAQVKSNINSWKTGIDRSIIKKIQSIFINDNEKLLNPALWP